MKEHKSRQKVMQKKMTLLTVFEGLVKNYNFIDFFPVWNTKWEFLQTLEDAGCLHVT